MLAGGGGGGGGAVSRANVPKTVPGSCMAFVENCTLRLAWPLDNVQLLVYILSFCL